MAEIVDILVTFLIIDAVLAIIGTLLFSFVCMKQREQLPYLSTYIFYAIGNSVYILKYYISEIFDLIGNLFYIFVCLSVLIASCIEYNRIRVKSEDNKIPLTSMFIILSLVSNLSFLMKFGMCIIYLISSIMLLRIQMLTKSVTKLLLFICTIIGNIGIIVNIFTPFEYEYIVILDVIITTVWITMLLANGIIALLEIKIYENLKIKDELKDKYSHDVGNILQSLYLSYELMKNKAKIEEGSIDYHKVFEKKINEVSDVVRDIREL